MIEVLLSTQNNAQVVELIGDIDASSAPQVVEKLQPIMTAGSSVLIDMAKVEYMSSAGLRMLLTVYRAISGQGGKVVLSGLSEELTDTMSMTGFLDFFEHYTSLKEGLAALTAGG